MMDKGIGQKMKLKRCDLETRVNCYLDSHGLEIQMKWKHTDKRAFTTSRG